jgi:hypothetical protein
MTALTTDPDERAEALYPEHETSWDLTYPSSALNHFRRGAYVRGWHDARETFNGPTLRGLLWLAVGVGLAMAVLLVLLLLVPSLTGTGLHLVPPVVAAVVLLAAAHRAGVTR